MANFQTALERGISPSWVGRTTKVCSGCGIEKSVDEFSWGLIEGKYYPKLCWFCSRTNNEKIRRSNIEKELCKYCGKPRGESSSKILCQECRNKSNMASSRNYYKHGGKERQKEWQKEWLENGGREYYANYARNRLQTDPDFYWAAWVRCGTRRAFRGKMSDESSLELLGLTIAEFQEYLDWLWPRDTKGKKLPRKMVHIDHIIPLNYGDGKSEQVKKQLCHFTNLMPITSEENLAKNGALPEGFHGFWFEQFEQEVTP